MGVSKARILPQQHLQLKAAAEERKLPKASAPPKDGAPKDGAANDGAANDGAPKDGTLKDSAPKEGAPKDSALKDGAPKDDASKDGTKKDDEGKNFGLGPIARNHMKLYSYYKPSLAAGTYKVYAEQNIHVQDTEGGQDNLIDEVVDSHGVKSKVPSSMRVWNRIADGPNPDTQDPEPQVFEVMAPQFSLDPKLIDSYYPPDGHQDEAKTLPHICFNDPHLPWERDPGLHISGQLDPDIDPKTGEVSKTKFRSMAPWLALIVFHPDELRLNNATEGKLLGIPDFEDPAKVDMNKAQNHNGTFAMTVKEYLKLNSRIKYEAASTSYSRIKESSEPMTAIFPTKDVFLRIFKNYPDDDDKDAGKVPEVGKVPEAGKVPPPPKPVPASYNIEYHKYLAHVRHINTTGCPDAGIDQEGLFSILISSRTGALSITQPTPQICHLVSIEHIDSTYDDVVKSHQNLSDTVSDRIGMVSLFSWIYMGLPPNPYTFVEAMRDVIGKRQLLRPSNMILESLSQRGSGSDSAAKVANMLHRRFSLGYIISRWRTETGEEVAAFNRGPLVPQPVERPKDLKESSNTSREYQIVDLGTGLVDLSYSSAWQLGKLLAISDTTFNAALMRFRSLVYNKAADEVRKLVSDMQSAAAAVQSVANGIGDLAKMSAGHTGEANRTIGSSGRPQAPVPPPMDHPDVSVHFKAATNKIVQFLSLAGDKIYGDLLLASDKPNNNDWVIIHNWVFEKMYLSDIPAHYLIPDPSFLPPESLRFFHIDDTWLDCLIDGALSVANHLDRDDDKIRSAIKDTLNTYLKTEVQGIVPQIPSCGFILRCQIVKVMPDLRITVKWEKPDEEGHDRHEVCRYTRLDDETIMALFDRPFEELHSIILAQPPHQQNFSLGHRLVLDELDFLPKHLYTQAKDDVLEAEWPMFGNDATKKMTDKWFIFDPATRCINLKRMATDLNQLLQKNQPSAGAYQDKVANSCEMAMELNNPSYYFEITPEVPNKGRKARMRRLHATPPSFEAALPKPETSGVTAIQKVDPLSTKDAPGGPPKDAVPIVPMPALSPARPTNMTHTNPTPIPANSQNTGGSLSLTPNFTLSVFPDYKRAPPPFHNSYDDHDCVPTKNNYYYDLIFSVRKVLSAGGSPLKLKEITINIPHEGMYKTNPKTEALIEENYDGPGARMLSNQRFVPFLNKSDRFLTVRLIPRSATKDPTIPINDSRTTEVSFKLGEPKIAKTTNSVFTPIKQFTDAQQQRGKVRVLMTEKYDTKDGIKFATSDNWIVIKNDITDKDVAGNPL